MQDWSFSELKSAGPKGHHEYPGAVTLQYSASIFSGPLCNRETIYIFMVWFVMVALCNRADHYIFILFLLLSSFFFLFSLA